MIRIITDSAADFEPHELKENNIYCVPMQISFNDVEYKENENLSKEQFYELLEKCDCFPKTSQPAPHDFEVLLKEFMKNNDECIIITVSSSLSGTYQNASLVKNILAYENCYIVDSLNAAAGERLLTDYAIKLRNGGKSAKEIFDELEILKTKIKLYACLDTLEYLHRGGRLSKTAYTPDKKYPIYVLYSNNRKNGDLLADALRKSGFDVPDKNIINIGATIGSHIGPNACGVAYISED